MMQDLIIIGAGGFGAEAAWFVREISVSRSAESQFGGWNLLGFADSDQRKHRTMHAGYPVHGSVEQAAAVFACCDLWFFCAVGDNIVRRRLAAAAQLLGWKPAAIVHPSALIADTACILPGTLVGPLAVVSNNARVGRHVIVNMHASVGHDALVGDYCQLMPGSRVSGSCEVSDLASLGSNAVLLPGTRVGEGALVGACSLASGVVEEYTTVCGVPARAIRRGARDGACATSHVAV